MDRESRGESVSEDTWDGFGWRSARVPGIALPDPQRAALGVPRTLRTVPGTDLVQRPVFEPALKHFRNAYRAGDPQFADEQAAARWRQARTSALDHVLEAIADSQWADHLVLRGSVLLRTWYGRAAREPGDLDFVVLPESWQIEEPRTDAMLEAIAHGAELASSEGGVRISAAGAVSDAIWTYDRVPGRRLLLPWEADHLPGGWVQLDFVFNEKLPIDPEPFYVSAGSGRAGALVLGATPELSLAWKLLWLATDMHPQGKDLYDAVLLAENTGLRYDVLREVFRNASDGEFEARTLLPWHISTLSTEWRHFRDEYLDQPDSDDEYVQRLAAALEPTFAAFDGRPVTEYEAHAAWLGPHVERYRRRLAGRDMDTVQEEMAAARIPPLSAIVITRELLGRDDVGTDDARRLVVNHPAWAQRLGFRFGDGGALEAGLKALGVDLTIEGRPASPETRLARRVRRDFYRYGTVPEVLRLLAALPADSADPTLGSERILAAVVLLAGADINELHRGLALARTDRHELLEASGLADADWPQRLDTELGP
jgi:hypothetical protein